MSSSQTLSTPTPHDGPHSGVPAVDFIGSTSVISELIRGFDGPPPTYDRVKVAMYSGRIPAEKVGGRWMVDRARMGDIATAFGMTPKASRFARAPSAAVEHAAA